MPGRLSRRRMAEYVASELVAGKSKKVLFQQLAGYLVDTKRTKELELIIRDVEFSLASKGVVNASVVSAFELTAETKKALEAFVKTETKATKVTLANLVDPTVLGGVKITVPGREFDHTIAHQLTVLKTRFKKA